MKQYAESSNKITVSALVIGETRNEPKVKYHKNEGLNDYIAELSDEEKEAEFQRQHQEYMEAKRERKQEIKRQKEAEWGKSSSSQDDIQLSQSQSSTSCNIISLLNNSKPFEGKNTFEKEEELQVYTPSKKGKQGWEKGKLEIEKSRVIISNTPEVLKNLVKIKAMEGLVIKNCHSMKLTFFEKEVFIAASLTEHGSLPYHYELFTKIITNKLVQMGLKLKKHQNEIIPGIPSSISDNSLIYGKLMKKSQILGRWEERIIVLNNNGIYSYKRFNEKFSMFIPKEAIKELWTRFDIYEDHLIIKVNHSTKTEFGLPLTEIMDTKCWLYHFYQLLFKGL